MTKHRGLPYLQAWVSPLLARCLLWVTSVMALSNSVENRWHQGCAGAGEGVWGGEMGTPWLVTEPSSVCYALYSFQSPSTVIRPQRHPEQHVHSVWSNLAFWLPGRVYRPEIAREESRRVCAPALLLPGLCPQPSLLPGPLPPMLQRHAFWALEQPSGKSVYLQGEKRPSKKDF